MQLRRAVRVVGWNALLLLGVLSLLVLGGETYFRLTKPFMSSDHLKVFVPWVGLTRKPGVETRYTNRLDFWTVSRANRLGFLDREPPRPARAAASCHLTMIGDSYVEAREVPIADKFHVQLEALAGRALPQLHITTSAFGLGFTGQVQQLAFYDAYARSLHPKLVVLVFVPNDFKNNAPLLRALGTGYDPEHLPEPRVARRPDGTLTLRLPHPDQAQFRGSHSRAGRVTAAIETVARHSWFGSWLVAKLRPDRIAGNLQIIRRAEVLRQRPRYAGLLEGWQPTLWGSLVRTFARDELPPVFADALGYTAFALEQFKERADRDGARLVILASHRMKIKRFGNRVFDRLHGMAATLGIPVIDQAAYILRQGVTLSAAEWPHDPHWNAAGHRWAAEALLEWLTQHPEVCDGVPANGAP